tara:strand:- start:1436 stop:1885 length:450 start_codon:yes stop_codon:yes gene_type:complete
MTISKLLEEATIWLSRLGLALAFITIISLIMRWQIKFRLIGTTIFTVLLWGSCLAFSASYRKPFIVEGAKYVQVVYDNGYDLVVAQAPEDFPVEAIQPSLEQLAGNLQGGTRNRSTVNVRIRQIVPNGEGLSSPKIIGELQKNISQITN